MKKLNKQFFIAAFFYLAIVLSVFLPILWPPEGMLVFGDDIHRSYHFFRQLFGDAISRGEFPWWNPYLFSGEPLIANPSLSFWYPFNWLFAVFPYRYVFSWSIVFHVFWAMLGMYCALRAMSNVKCQMSNVGAWIGGLVFGLSGFFMGRIWEGHIELIAAASWMPWVVWANVKCQMSNVKWKTNCVVAGIVFALQLYAGYQTMALFTLEAVFIVTLLQSYFEKSWRPLIRAGFAVILGLGLAAIQIIPAQEFFRVSIRTYALPYSWAVFGSYTMENLKQLVDPFILGLPWAYRGPSPNYGEMAAFVGRVSLLLAAIAIVRRKSRMTIAFAAIAVFGLWVSFGWNAPIDLNKILWEIVPTYQYLRIPSRHLILFVFGMSALAGIGLNLVRHSLAKLVFSLVIVVDLVWFARAFVVLRPDPATRHNQELVSYLQKNLGLGRYLPNFNVGMGTRDALDFDAAMGYRLYSASGYDPAILRNYYEFAVAAADIKDPDVQQTDVQIPYLHPSSRFTDFLNIKYILVPTWFDSVGGPSAKYTVVLEENRKDYWRLYENKSALPRFYLVPSVTVYPNRTAVAAAIRAGTADPSKTVLTTDSVATDCKGEAAGSVTLSTYTFNTIRLETQSFCNAILATSEVMYPGWKAAVDGKETNIVESNLAFRAVPVPAGKHTVTMWYDPGIFVIGFFVSSGTVVVCLILFKPAIPIRFPPLFPSRVQNV
ncbi:YfhO family protein [Candidatus Gottesmanbacteria bacterium]|nr:YfhO family protein [Candidatus Gottesmanbacteria bacterium]